MSKLSEIMAAFLADLNYAQDSSNEYSKELAFKYRDDKFLKYFPVPNGLLDEAVITLRFMTEGTESAPPPPPSNRHREPSESLVGRLSVAIGRIVGEAVASHLEESKTVTATPTLAQALRSAQGAYKLSRHFTRDARLYLNECSPAEATDVARNATIEALAKSCASALGSDPDVSEAIEDIGATTAESFKSIHEALNLLLKRTGEHLRALNDVRPTTQDLKVLMDNGRLSTFPDFAVQTITLKATMRDFKWVIKEEDGTADGESETLVSEA